MRNIGRKKLREIIDFEIIKAIKEPLKNYISKDVELSISRDLERCLENRSLIYQFCQFCKEHLGITHPVTIEIVSNREDSGIETTAFYSPEDHDIKIYGLNRAIVDICRSIAHEMTHMKQMLNNELSFPVQDAGGEIEDEANAKAGEIVKLFAKSSPERKSIYENKIIF